VKFLVSDLKFLSTAAQFIKRSKKAILLIVISSAITLLISTAISIWLGEVHNMRIASIGTITVKGVRVYDGDLRNDAGGKLVLDWGTLYPGVPVTRHFFIINNESNVPVTLIMLDVKSANITFLNSNREVVTEPPPITKPFQLSCNFNNTVLKPDEEIYATLTLEVSSNSDFLKYLARNDISGFGFDLVLIAA
jgi:hypothetical protein